eukprot:362038-Chlamydomonas_euryale.AAC.3
MLAAIDVVVLKGAEGHRPERRPRIQASSECDRRRRFLSITSVRIYGDDSSGCRGDGSRESERAALWGARFCVARFTCARHLPACPLMDSSWTITHHDRHRGLNAHLACVAGAARSPRHAPSARHSAGMM